MDEHAMSSKKKTLSDLQCSTDFQKVNDLEENNNIWHMNRQNLRRILRRNSWSFSDRLQNKKECEKEEAANRKHLHNAFQSVFCAFKHCVAFVAIAQSVQLNRDF